MDYLRAFAISSAGMSAERVRVDAAAMNLANANTVVGAAGGYQPMRAVLRATSFASTLQEATPLRIPIASLEPTLSRPRLVPDAGHPLANAEGFVAYAGVDTATEMMTLMSALRSYEANVAALSTARGLVLKTLEIGRTS
jgi:flagellar basal-body rod protein FlgC